MVKCGAISHIFVFIFTLICSGGDNTRRHGSRYGGNTDAIQIEAPASWRTVEENRRNYTKALAKTIQRYMEAHYGFTGNSTLITTDGPAISGSSAFGIQVSILSLCSSVLFFVVK